MPICKKCNVKFPDKIVINNETKYIKGRQYCLVCSPFGKHNTRKLEIPQIPDMKKCPKCKAIKHKSKYHNRTDRIGISHYCRKCSNIMTYERQRNKGLKRKLEMVTELGGSCELCGYSKNLSALSFHHIDPIKKSFELDLRSFANRSVKACKDEANKCRLLCCNCHAEEHNPHLDIEKIKS